MEKKEEVTYNNDGSYSKVTKITTSASDGWIDQSKIDPHDIDKVGRYTYGKTTTYFYETNDKKIIRPIFTVIISIILIIVGLVMKNIIGIVIASISLIVAIIATIYLFTYIAKKKNNNQNIK